MQQINVLGTALEVCASDPVTGFYRNGLCEHRGDDPGMHVVCCVMTEEFLDFSRHTGNDLTTPRPEFAFPGLSVGDRWCICAARWAEALAAGRPCPVVLESTHISALEFLDLADLTAHAVSA